MRRNRVISLGVLIAGVIAVTAASTAMFTTMTIARLGGFFVSSVLADSLRGGQIGGYSRFAINGETTDSLHIGEVVYWSDTNKVSKSATLANYNAVAGVVVGGHMLTPPLSAAIAITDTSTRAAKPGGWVVILKQGRTWLLNDAAGAVTAGARLIPSDATQGRVEVAPASIDTLDRVIARAVIGAATGKAILADINIP